MNQLLGRFGSVDLHELNVKAALLERIDQKYVLNATQLKQLLARTCLDFEILTINNHRKFGYRSIYFDDDELHTFRAHNQGRRNRMKVRRRIYLDSGGCYFEVKIKGLRNRTHKYRLQIDGQQAQNLELTSEEVDFLQRKHHKHFRRPWPYVMQHSITIDYQRITLLAKHGSERLTIDQCVRFFNENARHALPEDRWIVEVKSDIGRSAINRWLLLQGVRPAARCSKYSMGISLLEYPHNSRFRPVLKRYFQMGATT